MAVTLSVTQLALAVRVTTEAVAPDEPYNSLLTRKLAVAKQVVERYAEGAPTDVQNEAVILIIGYDIDAPPSRPWTVPGNTFILSGARALLSGWHTPTGAKVVPNAT